ncbi:MAG: hypothetical protein HW390_3453 [Candidatus Brocadiaceae bacterium]|nr:hypothetical protein [Candidatus Brocadiaceae bacterium]
MHIPEAALASLAYKSKWRRFRIDGSLYKRIELVRFWRICRCCKGVTCMERNGQELVRPNRFLVLQPGKLTQLKERWLKTDWESDSPVVL